MKSSFKKKPLTQEFFERHTLTVARDLVGKLLIVRDPARKKKWITRIIETEVYRTDDRASHCSRGKTKRCAVMFEEPAHAYVYFIYGMYTMLNFVTEPEDTPGAVLIRALEVIGGDDSRLLSGPGKLCRELGIQLQDNRKSLLKGRFEVQDDGVKPPRIWVTPRVGIREEDPKKPWRFIWAEHPSMSKAPENKMILKTIKTKK